MTTSAHRTVEERVALGRAARRNTPRSSHGEWAPRDDRPDPVALLEEQAASRVPELVPLRYERMLASPFAFFRGAAAVMACDLAPTPRTGIEVQLCGDAHIANFGGFAAPDRRLVFDVNDFDETLAGPWEWDVKRMAASLAIAGRERGCGEAERRAMVAGAVGRYRTAMRWLAMRRDMEVWYARIDMEEVMRRLEAQVDRSDAKALRRQAAKASRKNSLRAFARLTEVVDGERRLITDRPLVVPIRSLVPSGEQAALTARLHDVVRGYRESLRPELRTLLAGYRVVDLAHKVVGVGSVGTRAWIVLMLGRDDGDPLFLQVKEAQRSTLEPHLRRVRVRNQGRRVVEGQRLMQAASDVLLGWTRALGLDGVERDFYVRQLWDSKLSADIEGFRSEGLALYGELCARTLARAHARSGDRIAIAAYLGSGSGFDRAVADFAEAYADRNEADHAALRAAADAGRVEAGSR